jgi:hypothetical protein
MGYAQKHPPVCERWNHLCAALWSGALVNALCRLLSVGRFAISSQLTAWLGQRSLVTNQQGRSSERPNCGPVAYCCAPPSGLTGPRICSTFVLMEVETLGIARSLGWRLHMRCASGYREGTRSMRRCVYRKQLDLETLVATRGPNFPLSRLEARLMCPACGSRLVTVVFEPPSNREVRSG